jgi:hypothetical protein
MDDSVDWVEVGRSAQELRIGHGFCAAGYAAKLAKKAREDGDASVQFWNAVKASLRPRA